MTTAAVLGQIAYWFAPSKNGKSKLRVRRDGMFWLAKSAADWSLELGITQKQAYRSIRVLKSKGLIQTKVMKFAGSPTTHIRLTDEGHKVVNCHSGDFHVTAEVNSFAPQGKSLTETTTENTTELNPAGKPAGKIQTKDMGEDKSNEEGKEKEKVEKQKKLVDSTNYKNESALAKLWRDRMLSLHPGFQKELTKKEYGQLKQFRSKVGDQAIAALEYALTNWSTLAWEVTVWHLAKSSPITPMVGFLLQHHNVLMNLFLKNEERKKMQKSEAVFAPLKETGIPQHPLPIEALPQSSPVNEPEPEEAEPIDPQFLIDKEFYSGLPRRPRFACDEAAYRKAFDERKKQFAEQGKFPFCVSENG